MRVGAPCDHSDFTCDPCERERQAEHGEVLASAMVAFRLAWSDEAQFPWLRTSGTRLHDRGCTFIQSCITAFHRDQDPHQLPRFVTVDEAMTPRRPAWSACKWCRPDVEPPERPRLPQRPKARRDELAEWLSQQPTPESEDGWREMADKIMARLWPKRR
jgi:hypothetical protein